MGWKGTMRSISAAARRMEKDAQRRHKQAVKDQTAADAADAVENWEQDIDDLLTIHTDLTDRIDWERLLKKPQPKEPVFKSHNQDSAKADLLAFKPSMFGFLGGGNSKRREALDEKLTGVWPSASLMVRGALFKKSSPKCKPYQKITSLDHRYNSQLATIMCTLNHRFTLMKSCQTIGASNWPVESCQKPRCPLGNSTNFTKITSLVLP